MAMILSPARKPERSLSEAVTVSSAEFVVSANLAITVDGIFVEVHSRTTISTKPSTRFINAPASTTSILRQTAFFSNALGFSLD